MARTEYGDPKAVTRRTYDEERSQYRQMEDDYIRDMTVKQSTQYSGHDYEKAIDAIDRRN